MSLLFQLTLQYRTPLLSFISLFDLFVTSTFWFFCLVFEPSCKDPIIKFLYVLQLTGAVVYMACLVVISYRLISRYAAVVSAYCKLVYASSNHVFNELLSSTKLICRFRTTLMPYKDISRTFIVLKLEWVLYTFHNGVSLFLLCNFFWFIQSNLYI